MTTATAPSEALPWKAIYPQGLSWETPLPARPLYAFLDEAAEAYPERFALDFAGRKTTYRELKNLVDRAARGLQEQGVTKGTKVGICLPNCPYTVIAYYAVLKAGGTVVNFNPLYTVSELAKQVRDSKTEIMVTIDLEQVYPKVREVLDQGDLRTIIVGRLSDCLPSVKGMLFSALKRSQIARTVHDDKHIDFSTLTKASPISAPPPIVPETDIAVLQYTGGTTGVPKGAMLTHANLSANTQQLMAWVPDLKSGEESIYGVLPFFHVLAMTVILNLGIAIAAELILSPRFDLQDTLKTMHKKRPTMFPGVPTIYTAINNAPNLGKFDLSSLKYCISGGAPLPIEVKKQFERSTGCVLVEGYGLTEASPVLTCNPLVGEARTGSIGIPMPHTEISMRAIDDTRRPVDIGERGELCARGPQVMAGYWERDDETANVLVDGWLRTGDVGHMDEDGYVFLTDRIKDVILCGGFNVYPRVIEEAIYEHPAVAEVAVIGVPDSYRGQSPKAFITLKDHGELSEEELSAFLATRLSRIEMPRAFVFRDDLPKTMIGKLSKKALQEEEEAASSTGADTQAGAASPTAESGSNSQTETATSPRADASV